VLLIACANTNAGSGSHFIDFVPAPADRDRANEPFTYMSIVAPGTFSALGIPLESGRDFNAGDADDRQLVAIVNEALVRRSLAGQDSIGRTIFCPFDRPNDGMTIIGVVGNVRQQNPAIEPAPRMLHAVHAAQLQQRDYQHGDSHGRRSISAGGNHPPARRGGVA
jgi:hypothetical protein